MTSKFNGSLHFSTFFIASQQTNELILRYCMIKIRAETRDKISIGMIVNVDFAQDDLERPNWSRLLAMLFEFQN